MSVEQKYTLRPQKSKENMYLDGYGKHWGEKLTFTIGISYTFSAIFGAVLGTFRYKPSNMFTGISLLKMRMGACMKTGGEFGNSGAAASLMYCLMSKTIDLLFEEEISEYGFTARNSLSAALTGALYKSTLGLRPMIFASLLGVGIINGLTIGVNYLNEAGLIRFRIEV